MVENKRPGGRYVRLMVAWKMMRGRGLQRLEEGDIRIWATVVYHNNVFTVPLVFHGPHTGDRRDRIVNRFSRSPPPPRSNHSHVFAVIMLSFLSYFMFEKIHFSFHRVVPATPVTELE